MPEAPHWKFQKIIKPMFDTPIQPLLLQGRLLTCENDQVIEDGILEIENGKIKAVAASHEFGARAEQAQPTGATLMPGLINSHAHLAWDGIHDLAQQSIYDTPEISAYKSAGNMLLSLRAGITTVRDLGMHQTNLYAKQAVEQGIFPGPRILACGAAIVQTGGHTYWACREASGPDEMRRAVREQVRGGADLIKIMASHDLNEFTDEELFAVIDEAHRNGLPITAHATFDSVINRVVQAGVDCVEHGGSMSDETIALLVERGIPIVTTFAPLVMQSQAELARAYDVPEWKIEERQKAVASGERFAGLVKAAQAGVMIGFGTDSGSPVVQHNVVAPEMQFMIDLGLKRDAYDALRSATSVAATINRLDQQLGRLKAGYLADVIVVDGQPDQQISDIERIQMTYRAGRPML
ncbi:amidohydrolase family protein [Deinococcus detaillensis]|uniref:Amidohydrolase family protein n=1 Tax=Deinococcus detaillensis TaxID=2592048 RepID=A0A553UNG1_9DEIO|nr:amidohydrolase family protein [Deinococcus detaillensis]TSA81725.1 amidohydrolase family protein [Deinococcus detaillensis]